MDPDWFLITTDPDRIDPARFRFWTRPDPWGPVGTHGDPWEPMGTHGDPWDPWAPGWLAGRTKFLAFFASGGEIDRFLTGN